METRAIEITSLVKEYAHGGFLTLFSKQSGRRSLDGIDLVVARGERLGLIGGNGAGKTTLLRCVAGLIPVTSGSVTVRGNVFYSSGFGTALAKGATVRENLRLLAAISGIERSRVSDVMHRVLVASKLESYADSRIQELSAGMVGRLSFFALLEMRSSNPDDILLLDEATTLAGDESFRFEAKRTLEEKVRSGITAIIASHSLATLPDLCDRIAWIRDGKVVACGAPREIIEAYRAFSVGVKG